MKRIIFFASFVGALFLLAGAGYFPLLHGTQASAVITKVRVANIMGPGAQVMWETDIPSDSRVAYGTGTSLANFASFSNFRCDGGGYVMAHCVNLTDLSVNTQYYYRVESAGTSGVVSFLDGFQFTSGSGMSTTMPTYYIDTIPPSVPSGLVATAVSSSQVKLSWAVSTDNIGVTGYKIYRNGFLLTTLSGISYFDESAGPGILYSYTVSAYDAAGNVSPQSAAVAATTLSSVAATVSTVTSTIDTTPPIITSVRVENSIGSGAQIKWTTDDLSDSLIQFDTATNTFVSNSSWRCDAGGEVTAHCINLTNLTSGTKYYYRVISKNSSGYETKSLEYGFVSEVATTTIGTVATTPTTTVTIVPSTLLPLTTTATGTIQKISAIIAAKEEEKEKSFEIHPVFDKKTVVSSHTKNMQGEVESQPVIPSTRIILREETPIYSGKTNETFIAEIPQFANYKEAEDLMRRKYQEAEKLFRKENKVPPARMVEEEEKIKIVEKIREQIPVLAPAAESVSLGTTTFSRAAEPERVVAEVSRVIAARIETPVFIDTDGDGISDYDEIHIYGTNPNKADTNGDGIKDGDKILAGIDPLRKEIVPVPYEDPREVVLAAKTDSKIFSVQKVETVTVESPEDASGTKAVPSSRIAFSGTALPNSFVTLYIFSTPTIVTVKTDSDGKWKYTMDKELENGKHEVYVAMTESSGKIIVKSDPIPFIKTAEAVTLQPNFALANTAVETPTGFFRGGTLTLSLVVLFIILGLSFMMISFVSKKRESSD